MRYLRIFSIVFFAAVLLFSRWVNEQYYANLNTDYPELHNTEEVLYISVEDPPEAIFRGLSAEDATDGDLTDQIMVASVSHFLEPGTVKVKYVVFDEHNNSATLSRNVHYVDYESPTFSMEKSPIYATGSSFDLLDYIKVEDCLDGDISDQIRVIYNMVNNYAVGNYPVLLEVSNSCGDTAQLTVWVTYTNEKNTASINLHRYLVYIEQGENFDPLRWVAAVTDQNAVALDPEYIEIQGNLDVNTPGSYQLVYKYDDGKRTGQTALTIVVTER